MNALAILTQVTLVLALVTTVCYAYQAFYLILPFFRRRQPPKTGKQRRYAILIAARNEEAVLPHLLDSINALDYPKELVTTFVIADNCTDNTADIARDHGAVVYTRFNRAQVGKGFALEYLLEKIRRDFGWDQFDTFLVFDADNLLRQDYLKQTDRLESYDAFTSFRNTKNFGDSWISGSSGLWYLHESVHMNLSRFTLGCNCTVSGTGFGFTSEILQRLGSWPFHLLTEDLEFNNWCATNNVNIRYCHDAIFYDEQPITLRQSWRQRTRWVQGGIQVSLRYSSGLLAGLFRGNKRYTCFELLTLSMWGFVFSSLMGIFGTVVNLLSNGWQSCVASLCLALLGAYFSMVLMAVLTVFHTRDRVSAKTGDLIKACLTFPLFMATYVPISITAVFKKFHWTPIAHTAAISTEQLLK